MRSKYSPAVPLLLLTLAACDRRDAAPAPAAAPPSTAPSPPAAPPAPSATITESINVPGGFAPVSYFQTKCARCHGPYGSFYGDGFGTRLNDEQLRAKVHDMVFGAAQSKLTDEEVAALASYHRSMSRKQPFITVTASEPQWAGECTPGAVVEISTPTGKVAAIVKGHLWTAAASADSSEATITATINAQETTIPLRVGEVSAHHAVSTPQR